MGLVEFSCTANIILGESVMHITYETTIIGGERGYYSVSTARTEIRCSRWWKIPAAVVVLCIMNVAKISIGSFR